MFLVNFFSKAFVGLGIVMISNAAGATDACPDPMNLIAEYRVEYVRNGEVSESSSLTLVRYEGAVLRINPALMVADQWFLQQNGRISRKQYFDEYQQGIEYAEKEANQVQADTDWGSKYSLLNENALSQYSLEREENDRCLSRKFFAGSEGNDDRVIWREDLKLPEQWALTRSGVINRLELVSVNFDKSDALREFRKREHYKLTDYADIGDSEDNPVIEKMLSGNLIDHDHHH